ncbi:MAG TPA: hypothetical protein PLR76_00225 [Hyphomonas sp.]|nr:hypothetical protein [Hyphomonas sp.]MCB9972530.1 hypothetical protein [Hyphomonas sp.]MCC0017747.1 hypothetical protein [Rhodobiaceae bacterium]HPE46783.1 hypothetical protein [Hyphomonas sp.]
MADKKRVLNKLVGLRRQKAEQDYLAARMEQEALAAEAERLTGALRALDEPDADAGDAILSLRFGHVRKVLSDIEASKAAAAAKEAELDEAREALKRAFDSEQRLKDMKSSR